MNYNGASESSDVAQFIICKSPSLFDAPTMPAVTQITMTIAWNAPKNNGGCEIYSYSLYQDDGEGGDLVEIDALVINNLPALRSHEREFTSADTSKTFRYYVTASNSVGTVQSETKSFVLAAVPEKPSSRPILNLELTTASQIHFDFAALDESANGGSPILSYEVVIYTREISDWVTISGGEGGFQLINTDIYSTGIEKGETYQLKYRVWNINGPGQYSEIGYVQAAEPPSRP